MKKLTEKFIKGLRGEDLHIFYNLFFLLELSDPDFLDEIVENYKKDDEDFFRLFHKSFRQCDIFDGDRLTAITYPKRTDENIKRRGELLKLREIYRRNYDINGKFESLKNDDEYENDETYINWGTELGIVSKLCSTISMDPEPIVGHLDSIFYQSIANDEKDGLYNYMFKFFKTNIK